jgi:phosphoribosylformylglycinamidine cyclo-ligase
VPSDAAAAAVALLDEHHPGTRVIGRVTAAAGRVTLPGLGVTL